MKLLKDKFFWIFIVGVIIVGGLFASGAMEIIMKGGSISNYSDIKKCQDIISDKMKDPDSTKFMEYEYSEDDKGTITINGKYKATNSYGAYIQGTFSCIEGGGIQMQAFID